MLISLWFIAAIAAPPELAAPAVSSDSRWEATLDKVVPAVVAIRVTQTRDFDTEDAGSSVGTGFVIDAERGILLTNRHMVHSGPVKAEAVFEDHEEVDLIPIYRDPVHDFGFYKFNPADVHFMKVQALELAPEAARVGMEIRVVGNDAGEKLSILDGTLARLDRNAPDYGGDTYNDFNTFYFQAASNTSGGSSGSPVVDIRGRVVALNAGGSRQAASSFYLPLDRIVEAYQHVIAGEAVPRGTLAAVFDYTPYDEVRRLGLSPTSEAAARKQFPAATGMLVVSETVPELSADGKLQSGDVLVSVDGQLINGFVPFEDLLDAKVGGTVTLSVERGGQIQEVPLLVEDLHKLTPAHFLEISRSILHDVSFQQARNHGVPIGGVYVAVPGYWLGIANVPSGSVITEIDGIATPNVDIARAELERKADGQRVTLRFHAIDEPRRARIASATVDRTWFPMSTCTRDDSVGLWPCIVSPEPPPPAERAPEVVSWAEGGTKLEQKLARSLVVVDFDIPHPTTGAKDFNYLGAGLVIDAQQGLVLVDRDTVPVALGDMTLTFGGQVRVPGTLVYLHPLHNLAIVKYDPALLGDTPIEAVEFVDVPLKTGDGVWQVGLDSRYRVSSVETTVERHEPLRLGIAGTPRFRDANIEGVSLFTSVSTLGGVLCDKKGRVGALWASFVDQGTDDRTFYGLPSSYITPMISAIRAGKPYEYRTIGAEFQPISLADARDRGLSESIAQMLVSHDPEGRRVLEVQRIGAELPADHVLREGDLLVAIDGEPVSRLRELERIASRQSVELTLFRDGGELTVTVPTVVIPGTGVDRVVSWAGILLHEPHLEVATQQGIPREGVYAAWMWYGSPSARYGLRPTRRIIEINGTPTPTLDALLAVVRGMKDGEAVRITSVNLEGKIQVATLELDLSYWPTQLLERQPNGDWTRTVVTP